MAKVLVLTSNFNKNTSSIGYCALEIFLQEYTRLNPTHEVERVDLNTLPMANKTLNSENLTSGFFNQEDTFDWIQRLKTTEKLVVLSPMTNFAPAPVLRNFIDHIMVADHTFSYKYSKKGEAIGLVTNLKVQIITVQGAPYGWYMWGNHTEYLRGCFEFIGSTVTKPVLISGTKTPLNAGLTPQEQAEKYRAELELRAREF